MGKVKQIIMERDGITEKEAEERMAECREELYNGNYNAMNEVLGLEDDYIFQII